MSHRLSLIGFLCVCEMHKLRLFNVISIIGHEKALSSFSKCFLIARAYIGKRRLNALLFVCLVNADLSALTAKRHTKKKKESRPSSLSILLSFGFPPLLLLAIVRSFKVFKKKSSFFFNV